ncbi:hypothetical protein QJS66_21755 [Kocuria rhizophila]|nr:hypothetical protein QJS66_21755 [Kocuria rhizophila]
MLALPSARARRSPPSRTPSPVHGTTGGPPRATLGSRLSSAHQRAQTPSASSWRPPCWSRGSVGGLPKTRGRRDGTAVDGFFAILLGLLIAGSGCACPCARSWRAGPAPLYPAFWGVPGHHGRRDGPVSTLLAGRR